MPWNGSSPNQSFGRSNGDHTGATVWATDDAESFDITSSRHDTHDQDMSDGINACLKKDGGNTATANLPMGGFKFTNLAAGAARADSARIADVQDSKATYYPTVGGTADAITLTGAAAAITAYAAGQTFSFLATATNTGAATINVDGVAVKDIKDVGGSALQAGAIVSGGLYTIRYDGTRFQLSTVAPVAITVGTMMAWPTATVPTGWLECYGQAISRTTYADLFAVLSTTYGVGDGSTTFNLPDLRGRVIAGEDDMGGTSANRLTGLTDGVNGDTLGAAGGLESTTIAQANLPNVNFSVSFGGSISYDKPNLAGFQAQQAGGSPQGFGVVNFSAQTATNNLTAQAASGGSGTATNNVPPTIVLKWIILALPSATLPAYGGGVNAVSGFTASARNVHTGNNPATAAADGTNLDIVVTELYVAEVFVPCNMTVNGAAPFFGANTNGNAKVMLFNSAGTRVALSASTAVGAFAADDYTGIDFSAPYTALGPATYYVGIICDDNTNDLNTHVVGRFGAGKITGLVYATEAGYASITVPTTFTTGLGPIASLY